MVGGVNIVCLCVWLVMRTLFVCVYGWWCKHCLSVFMAGGVDIVCLGLWLCMAGGLNIVCLCL